jgi:4-hydroxy-3-polyprenylbenzoate decarboxylase
MIHRDLRTWLKDVEGLGELRIIRGAHWDIEIGVLAEYLMRGRKQPAVLFDEIVDHAPGYRLLVNEVGSTKRLALTLGFPVELDERAIGTSWRKRRKEIQLTPPKYVKDGPVMENVFQGENIDMLKFPAPRWHEHDGGRYLGTGDAAITADPENGKINMGTYRVMTLDRDRVFLYISPGKDGRIHREKYFARKEPMPAVVVFGSDPLLHLVSSWSLPPTVCELDYLGGINGEPIEVIRGPVTGLPVPAHAEIVIEGFVMPDEQLPEGPFGEWTGYYASHVRPEPVFRVKALYHRNDPIILGSPPVKPPSGKSYMQAILRSAAIEEDLALAGVPDVKSVWCHEAGAGRMFVVIAIRQRYPGQAKQAGVLAAQCRTVGYLSRYFVVVDDDIDPMNLEEVIWAICTRSNPDQDIDVLRRCWSGPLDPMISPEQRKRREFFNSRAVIDATRPFEWRDDFPAVSESSPELKEKVLAKWRDALFGKE